MSIYVYPFSLIERGIDRTYSTGLLFFLAETLSQENILKCLYENKHYVLP